MKNRIDVSWSRYSKLWLLWFYVRTFPNWMYLNTKTRVFWQFRASNMILNVHSDALYPSEKRVKTELAGIFSWDVCPGRRKICLSMEVFISILCGILRLVVYIFSSGGRISCTIYFLIWGNGELFLPKLVSLVHRQVFSSFLFSRY